MDPGSAQVRHPAEEQEHARPRSGERIFRKVSGEGTVSQDGEVTGTVAVAAASIDAKNTRRDTHLRSSDFFDSNALTIYATFIRR
jgi:polyisoprenoid-binding protein YceI